MKQQYMSKLEHKYTDLLAAPTYGFLHCLIETWVCMVVVIWATSRLPREGIVLSLLEALYTLFDTHFRHVGSWVSDEEFYLGKERTSSTKRTEKSTAISDPEFPFKEKHRKIKLLRHHDLYTFNIFNQTMEQNNYMYKRKRHECHCFVLWISYICNYSVDIDSACPTMYWPVFTMLYKHTEI